MKTTFDFTSDSITGAVQKIFKSVESATLRIASGKGNEIVNIPLFLAIILAVVFPLFTIIAVLLSIGSLIRISIVKKDKTQDKLIDLP